jgi:hypothetical protein
MLILTLFREQPWMDVDREQVGVQQRDVIQVLLSSVGSQWTGRSYLHTLFTRVQTHLGLKSRNSSMVWMPVPSMAVLRDSSILSKPTHGWINITFWTGLTECAIRTPRAPILVEETHTF